MNRKLAFLIKHRDTALLATAFVLLLLALLKPSVPLKHNIYTYLLVVDISQSMNAEDMSLNGKSVTRIAYVKKMLHEVTSSLPCGTKVSIGLYAGNAIAALYTPIEICENFAAIQDTIDHLDWRNAWSGNSRFRESLYVTAKAVRALPEPAQVVYFTDGEEAPKLHAFNTKSLAEFQGADGWIFVGIGTKKGVAIPKLSEDNQVIGYWSNESFAMQPGIAQISESTLGVRDDNVAVSDHDRFISKLAEEYMISVAKEVGAQYIEGTSAHAVSTAMKAQKPARREVAPFKIDWVLALGSLLALLGTVANRHPLRQMKQTLRIYRQEIRSKMRANELKIQHDNHFK